MHQPTEAAGCWCFLHHTTTLSAPKEQVIQNQTATQQLNGLIVRSREVKSIRQEDKECIVFRHEDFGGQLLWALERGVVVDIEGLEETFFNQPQPADAAAPPAAAGATDQAQQQQQQGGGGAAF